MASSTSDLTRVSLVAGLVLLLFGVQLLCVESYVCTPEATALLSRWAGPSTNTPQGRIQQIVVKTASVQKVFTPEPWFRWAVLSVGGVLTAHSLMAKLRK